MEGRRAQIHLSARQVAKNVSYTGTFLGMLAARAMPFAAGYYLQSCQDLQLVYFLVVLTKRLVVVLLRIDSIYTNMINDIEYRNIKAMVYKCFKDYIDEIQQSYVLGFTPYRLHSNVQGTFVTPICVYSGKVFVLDDVATMEVSDWCLETDTIK